MQLEAPISLGHHQAILIDETNTESESEVESVTPNRCLFAAAVSLK